MKYKIANPRPVGTIAFLEQLGYTIESAVADLVDKHHGAGTQHRHDIHGGWPALLGSRRR